MHEGDAEEIKYRSKSARSNQGRMIEEGRSPVDNGAATPAAPPDYSSPEWDRGGGGHDSFWTTPRKLACVGGVSLFLVVFIGACVSVEEPLSSVQLIWTIQFVDIAAPHVFINLKPCKSTMGSMPRPTELKTF